MSRGLTPDELKEIITGIVKGSVFNDGVTADTDIFDPVLSPTNSPTVFRIYACFVLAGKLTVRRTSGGTTVSEILNVDAELVAEAAYLFDIFVEEGETINLRYSVTTTARALKVVEVPGVIS